MTNIYVLIYDYKQNAINFNPTIKNFLKKTIVKYMKKYKKS